MKQDNKMILSFSLILNIILVVLLIFSIYNFNKAKPLEYIKGFYQSTEYLPDLYEFNFTEEEFFIKFNDIIIEKGKYNKYKNNIFICYGEKDTQVISLLNKSFYIYDNNKSRVIEMKKVSDVPLS
ncbi:hypothetical protein KQI86_07095 [Clostridium sp. MSJ-11]|uniref:Lipoprotein n=1 Tax=Clostridium mobile TaxID=2841512 RepID=A0ABS6EHB2_9CLOT|nr:hypothetical protein [Clostridium mobile]MBU5484091.1 hypothetical protein [Clostridium mobile]